MTTAPASPLRAAAGGMSLVEVTVAMGIIAATIVGLAGTIALGSKQAALTRDMAIAVDGARRQADALACADFKTLFVSYNEAASDDPGGAGTAVGPHFDVAGLSRRPGASHVGMIMFPTGTATTRLSETVTIPALGMPRDLNGNGAATSGNVATSYVLLPARIHVEWRGSYGDSSYDLYVLLADRGS